MATELEQQLRPLEPVPGLGAVGLEWMPEFVAIVVGEFSPGGIEVFREPPGPFRGVCGPARDAVRDSCGPFQESLVAGRLVGRQVGLRQVHVGVLAAVGLGLVEFAVEDIDARAVGLHPEPLDDVQGRCQQLLAPGNSGGGGGTGAEQDVGLPVEFFTGAGGIASDGREPSAVLGVAAGAVQVKTDAVPGHVLGSGAPLHGCYGEAVQHSCAQPHLRSQSGQGAALRIEVGVARTGQHHLGLEEVQQRFPVPCEPVAMLDAVQPADLLGVQLIHHQVSFDCRRSVRRCPVYAVEKHLCEGPHDRRSSGS